MRKKLVLAAIAMFAANITLNAQATAEEIVRKFFADFESSGSSVALDNLYKTNEWIMANQPAIEDLKTKLGGLNEELIGKYYGHELISQKQFTDTYVVYSYLIKFDRQPIRFIFQFYKPDDRWKVYSFEYDGNFGEEMADSVRLPEN